MDVSAGAGDCVPVGVNGSVEVRVGVSLSTIVGRHIHCVCANICVCRPDVHVECLHTLCVCLNVCVHAFYVCVFYLCTHVYICLHAYRCIMCLCASTWAFVCLFTRVCSVPAGMCLCVCLPVCLYACLQVRVSVHIRVYVCFLCPPVGIPVCTGVRASV